MPYFLGIKVTQPKGRNMETTRYQPIMDIDNNGALYWGIYDNLRRIQKAEKHPSMEAAQAACKRLNRG